MSHLSCQTTPRAKGALVTVDGDPYLYLVLLYSKHVSVYQGKRSPTGKFFPLRRMHLRLCEYPELYGVISGDRVDMALIDELVDAFADGPSDYPPRLLTQPAQEFAV
jgi:hypothetical protein